jgi:hypothetical protein
LAHGIGEAAESIIKGAPIGRAEFGQYTGIEGERTDMDLRVRLEAAEPACADGQNPAPRTIQNVTEVGLSLILNCWGLVRLMGGSVYCAFRPHHWQSERHDSREWCPRCGTSRKRS